MFLSWILSFIRSSPPTVVTTSNIPTPPPQPDDLVFKISSMFSRYPEINGTSLRLDDRTAVYKKAFAGLEKEWYSRLHSSYPDVMEETEWYANGTSKGVIGQLMDSCKNLGSDKISIRGLTQLVKIMHTCLYYSLHEKVPKEVIKSMLLESIEPILSQWSKGVKDSTSLKSGFVKGSILPEEVFQFRRNMLETCLYRSYTPQSNTGIGKQEFLRLKEIISQQLILREPEYV